MRQISTIIFTLLSVTAMMAQGWPSQYKGVMLQGFYWDSYTDTQWANLESQADELAEFFNLIWIPQSGKSANYQKIQWVMTTCTGLPTTQAHSATRTSCAR